MNGHLGDQALRRYANLCIGDDHSNATPMDNEGNVSVEDDGGRTFDVHIVRSDDTQAEANSDKLQSFGYCICHLLQKHCQHLTIGYFGC